MASITAIQVDGTKYSLATGCSFKRNEQTYNIASTHLTAYTTSLTTDTAGYFFLINTVATAGGLAVDLDTVSVTIQGAGYFPLYGASNKGAFVCVGTSSTVKSSVTVTVKTSFPGYIASGVVYHYIYVVTWA